MDAPFRFHDLFPELRYIVRSLLGWYEIIMLAASCHQEAVECKSFLFPWPYTVRCACSQWTTLINIGNQFGDKSAEKAPVVLERDRFMQTAMACRDWFAICAPTSSCRFSAFKYGFKWRYNPYGQPDEPAIEFLLYASHRNNPEYKLVLSFTNSPGIAVESTDVSRFLAIQPSVPVHDPACLDILHLISLYQRGQTLETEEGRALVFRQFKRIEPLK